MHIGDDDRDSLRKIEARQQVLAPIFLRNVVLSLPSAVRLDETCVPYVFS